MDKGKSERIQKRNEADQDFITKEAKRILEEKKNGKNRSNQSQNRGPGGKG